MRMAAAPAWMLGVFATGVLGWTSRTLAADSHAEASLVRAVPAATDTEIDGVNWHCTADKCVGTSAGRRASGSRVEECKALAAAVGKLTSFSSRGKELSKRDLDACNRVAR
jgi:hypothetical protein